MNRFRIVVLTLCAVLLVTCSLVFAGVVNPGGDKGSGGGSNGTNTGATVDTTINNNTSSSITAGNIGINFNQNIGFFPNQSVSENFAQLQGSFNAQQLEQLISICGSEGNSALASEVQSLLNSNFNTDPCSNEFSGANLNLNSLVFNATTTTTSTQTIEVPTVEEEDECVDYGCGCCCDVCVPVTVDVAEQIQVTTTSAGALSNDYDQNAGNFGATVGATNTIVPNTSCEGNIAEIEQNTIGDRVASSSSSQVAQNTFAVASVNTVSNSVSVSDTAGGLNFGTSTVTNNTTTNTTNNVTVNQVQGNIFVSPIVLDMSGSGKLEASNGLYLPHPGKFTRNRAIKFDFMADGFPFIMEWVGPHDGLLVQPKPDGSVDGTCLFGVQGGWDHGYEKLATLDTNGDEKLTGDELKGLAVWVDANGNGVADPGEVKTLAELGITEINLHHSKFQSTFVMNGKTQKMWDWWPSAMEIKTMRLADLNELYKSQPAK